MQAVIEKDSKGKFTGINYDESLDGSLVEQGKAMNLKDKVAMILHFMATRDAEEKASDTPKIDVAATRTEIKELKKQVSAVSMIDEKFIATIPDENLRNELMKNRDDLAKVCEMKQTRINELEKSIEDQKEENKSKEPTNDDLLMWGVIRGLGAKVVKPKSHKEDKPKGEKTDSGNSGRFNGKKFSEFVKDKIAQGKTILMKGIDDRKWEYTPEIAKTKKMSQAVQDPALGGYGSPRDASNLFIKVVGEDPVVVENPSAAEPVPATA